LRPVVGALGIHGGRVMGLPEGVDQLLVGNHLGIVLDLDDLRVAGVAGADLLVGWILLCAPRIAAGDRLDAGEHLVDGFGAPETAAAQRGDLKVVG